MDFLDPSEWTELAIQHELIPATAHVHGFQFHVANQVLMRRGDAVVISPTGSGKSLIWVLPLVARKEGVSLVITPYTSLGLAGELLNNHGKLKSIFIFSEQNADQDFETAATEDIKANFREELSTIVLPMEHEITCFLDIAFILPLGCREADLVKTLIYVDDIELLTKMFWWACQRAASIGLRDYVIDIIYFGLSVKYQEICLEAFRAGRTLGPSKISTGMNFPGVHRVIQYKCCDLTIADLDQRRGRGARSPGEFANSSNQKNVLKPSFRDALSPGVETPLSLVAIDALRIYGQLGSFNLLL
ncbi:hypothetical protein B0H13DRAFT_1871021 [Mycena leptocephala]|nr:hypothetical protein B0H13DRAFT_1871021 [Mycena leptocephala]